jgi:hypothetical protein
MTFSCWLNGPEARFPIGRPLLCLVENIDRWLFTTPALPESLIHDFLVGEK